MKKVRVWTKNYRPFILGGDVNAPIMFDVEILGYYGLGRGYSGYLFESPSGKTFVAESETGAIVGTTLHGVRVDIAGGDDEVMRKQIAQGKQDVKSAYLGTEDEFWKKLE